MASKAHFLANTVRECFEADKKLEKSNWYRLLELFRRLLIADISSSKFADIFAQTVAYGLFVARLNDPTPESFSRDEASGLIPKINPFLRVFFQSINKYDIDRRIAWIIDDFVNLFLNVDVIKIEESYKNKNESDPFFHFYEDFLGEYSPEEKVKNGVWYTPQPIVRFIVKSIDKLLQKEFGLTNGLADSSKVKVKEETFKKDGRTKSGKQFIEKEYHRVQILDPATGSGTFLVETVNQIYKKFKNQQGMWHSYVDEHLIYRINAFEILMAPYVIAHLKLGNVLEKTGYDSNNSNHTHRLRIYLTNALESPHDITDGYLFSPELDAEAKESSEVKEKLPIMVIMGNPPYNASSQNKNTYIDNLMLSYKQEPGIDKNIEKASLNEKNVKWINDDYVKFIRLAQEYVTRNPNGNGLIGFITAHGFIDNPTFRGMRYNLLKTFDKIYILNLHGNAKKKEVCLDGSKDENVFDIQQGVAITFFVKTNKKQKNGLGQVFYGDLYGLRKEKYSYLNENDITQTELVSIENIHPHYFFTPKNINNRKEYQTEKFFGIDELFDSSSAGFVSARDSLCIKNSYQEVLDIVDNFSKMDVEEARKFYQLKKDAKDWKVIYAQEDINRHRDLDGNINKDYIQKISYRPFDPKWTYYTGKTKGFLCRPRFNVMKNLLNGENLTLCLSKYVKTGNTYQHVFVSNLPIDSCFVSNRTSEITYAYPLFVYKDGYKESNLNLKIVEKFFPYNDINNNCNNEVLVYKIFDYVYAYLHATNYRQKYIEFLKMVGFPRIPYPKTKEEFKNISELGCQLRKIHLMDSLENYDHNVSYPVDGNNIVKECFFDKDKIFINETQYFGNIPESSWKYMIGAYQPALKYLNDRKGKQLTYNEIFHYENIIHALNETILIINKIDKVIS